MESGRAMKNRQANDTIKGYFYQFNKTIYEILSQKNPNAKVIVEGIEDIDIKVENMHTAIQCKYYSKQTYNHSVIKEAIIYMIKHFSDNKSSNLRYKIYANFKAGQTKLPSPIQIEFFKDNFLTYKEKGILHKVYEELNLSDNEIEEFIKKLDIDINASDYNTLEQEAVSLIQSELNCTNDLIDLYFIKAGSIVKNIAIEENENKRCITKKEFINMLMDVNIALDKWYMAKIDKEKYCNLIRKKYFSKHNISPYERFFIIECPKEIQISILKKITITISDKWSKLSKRTPQPFCPYVIFTNLSEEKLLLLKQSLYSDNFKFIDGYDYKGAQFSVDSITQEANYKNGIKIKIFDLNVIDNVLKDIKKAKEIYHFYINNQSYHTNNENQISIRVDNLDDILNII